MKIIDKLNLLNSKLSNKHQKIAIEYLKEKCSEECERENIIRNNCNLLITAISILTTAFMQIVYKLMEIFPNNTKFLLMYACVSFALLFSSVLLSILANSQFNDKINRDLISCKEISNDLIIDDLNKKYLNILSNNIKKYKSLSIAYGMLLAFMFFTFVCVIFAIL